MIATTRVRCQLSPMTNNLSENLQPACRTDFLGLAETSGDGWIFHESSHGVVDKMQGVGVGPAGVQSAIWLIESRGVVDISDVDDIARGCHYSRSAAIKPWYGLTEMLVKWPVPKTGR